MSKVYWNNTNEKEGHSACMVKNNSRTEEQNDDSLCSKTFKGKFTTNLKLHLKKEHSEEYKLFEEEEKKKQKKTENRRKAKSDCASSNSFSQQTN